MIATGAASRKADLLRDSDFPPSFGDEDNAERDQPERPAYVEWRYRSSCELPSSLLVRAQELRRGDDKSRSDRKRGPSDPIGNHVATEYRNADGCSPRSGEQVTQMLSKANSQVLMKRTKGDRYGVTRCSAGIRVLAPRMSGRALWWAAANPLAWALAWLVTTYVITTNVKEHFPNFGLSGAVVFALLTWLLLTFLFRRTDREASA
jgi:hypothetical protein